MRAYTPRRTPKGLSGCRKSKTSVHRSRCLRTDKKSMRQQSAKEAKEAREALNRFTPSWSLSGTN